MCRPLGLPLLLSGVPFPLHFPFATGPPEEESALAPEVTAVRLVTKVTKALLLRMAK